MLWHLGPHWLWRDYSSQVTQFLESKHLAWEYIFWMQTTSPEASPNPPQTFLCQTLIRTSYTPDQCSSALITPGKVANNSDSPYTPAPAKIIQSTRCNFKPAYPGFPCLASSFSQKPQQTILPLLSAHVLRCWIDSGASSGGSLEYGVLHLLLLGICEYKSSSFMMVISACFTTQDKCVFFRASTLGYLLIYLSEE